MQVKDLYYKKYLKYKNKYLNLRNLIGGAPPPPPDYDKHALFLVDKDELVNLIYSIKYNPGYSIFTLKPRTNMTFILAELNERKNRKIITVKINNLFLLYTNIIKPYKRLATGFYSSIPQFPSHITKLIFEGNPSSEEDIIDLIIIFITKFKMLSSLSFKSCSLTEEYAIYLLDKLIKLGKTFTEIDLSENGLSQETKYKFNVIKNKIIIDSNDFSVEELKKLNITTIKLENVMEYSDIVPTKLNGHAFMNITTLIFDGNDLSTNDNVDLIVSIIKIFQNVSSFSFKSCSLTETSATYLLQELKKLGKTFTEIDLSDNDKLTPATKDKFNVIKNKIIIDSNDFSVEELKKHNITTIKLENVIPDIVPKLDEHAFMNITTLIFDGNDLSTIDNVDLIVSIIKIFQNVSSLSFKLCSLTKESAKYLEQQLKLGKTFTEFNLEANDELTN